MTRYRVESKHAEVTAEGRSYAPDAVIEMDETAENHPHNQRLINEGILVLEVDQPSEED